MQIHLVTDQFSMGGGIEHIFQICRGLPEFQFKVYGMPGPASEKFSGLKNVEIHDKGFHPGELLDSQPDLIHFHHLRPLVSFIKHPFKKCNAPVIFTAHGLHIHKYEFYNSVKASIDYSLRYLLEKWVLRKPQRIIAVSQEDKDFLEEKYHLKNVIYLTNGIDFSFVEELKNTSKTELREKLHLPSEQYLFVTVARFDFQKGYDILIRALSSIKEYLREYNCRFLFIGDGSEFKAMQELSRQLSVSSFIDFLGARTDVYDFLKAADAFLLPSRWEGLPIVLIEAGLLNVPVIASDTYGNREILKNGNGLLFKNRDHHELGQLIVKVLEKKCDLQSLSNNLFNEIQSNYCLERMLTGLRELYLNTHDAMNEK